ncbi:hypothetical protein C0993_005202, partial [Termitomyces sp. T159_Od127]
MDFDCGPTRFRAGDEEVLALWRRFRALSIKAYEQAYERLNVYFDVYSGESQVRPEGIAGVMRTLKEKGLLTTKTIEESKQYHGAQSNQVVEEAAPEGDDDDVSSQGEEPDENGVAENADPPLALA